MMLKRLPQEAGVFKLWSEAGLRRDGPLTGPRGPWGGPQGGVDHRGGEPQVKHQVNTAHCGWNPAAQGQAPLIVSGGRHTESMFIKLRPNPVSTPYPFPLPLPLVLKG